jgi:uncharacterized damage-inducible protein DinB
MIYPLFADQLKSLQFLLQNLEDEHYVRQSPLLGNASIGQHIRHTIELAQALLNGYETGEINYDIRNRDLRIETDIPFAADVLANLLQKTALPNKVIQVVITNNNTGETVSVSSNYFRELAYNTEHTIHHMALIRVALREMQLNIVNDQFGVAPSTVKYRDTCAQ